ncbi:hypothetical protein HH212_21010 [Massilia forsythiae]|uniref:Uncharacterized protein n=1 Tax=Massilia forsythiae TaxID=2728020 RepID=A0A7Z2VZD0_9BURK|nr:hypothetical protein [Massilia forsythiae]QJE02192.1 hypothetical protein HH212_21010 [Massilia forsythiae]
MHKKSSPRLPLHTVEQLFEKLKYDESRLEQSWSVYDTFNFVVTAHHLYIDWLQGKRGATAEQAHRAHNLSSEAKALFKAVTEVSNGTKHWELTDPKKKESQIIDEVTPPCIDDYESYCFGEMVHFRFNDYYISIFAASALIIGYFEWMIFGKDKPTADELDDALASFKIAPT